MTTGQAFRVENPATVSYLRRIGRTWSLVTARASQYPSFDYHLSRYSRRIRSFGVAGIPVNLLHHLCPVLTITVLTALGAIKDWWRLGVLGMLVLAGLIRHQAEKPHGMEGRSRDRGRWVISRL